MSSSKKLSRWIIRSGMGFLLMAGTLGYAEAPAEKWYDAIGISGYLQGSYVGNLRGPNTGANQGRQFDTTSNTFTFNRFLLQVAKPVGETDHYGFTAKLAAGDDAQVLNTAAGSTASDVAVEEAYITYVVPSLTKLQVIGGKFVTLEGVELVDTIYNPNFSEGLLFTYAEPIAHTGVKANYAINDKANATVGLVNAWDLVKDNNDQKTILWQLATTPIKKISWTFQGSYGDELARNQAVAASDHSTRLSLDTVLGYNPTDKLSLFFQANWGQQTNDPNTASSLGTTHWSGLGVWASYALTSKFTESVRFEVLADQNNANRFGASAFASGTTNQTVKEVTLTHKTKLAANLFNRVEYRHDWSNEPYFQTSTTAVRNQNTISTDFYVTF